MGVEIILAIALTLAMLALAAHAWWTMPETDYLPESVEVGHVAAALPPRERRDVLDDYALLLDLEVITAVGAAEHRLSVLEALLEEADHETVRLELLVNKLGRELLPAAASTCRMGS